MRLTTNTRCAIYTAAVLILCAVAQAAFSAESAPVVNVNTATAAQLSYLPGIGKTIAERIVTYRTENGPFACSTDTDCESADYLLPVKGIGAAKLAKIRPYVVLSGDTTATAKIKVAKGQ